jgi:hypothetical protein
MLPFLKARKHLLLQDPDQIVRFLKFFQIYLEDTDCMSMNGSSINILFKKEYYQEPFLF